MVNVSFVTYLWELINVGGTITIRPSFVGRDSFVVETSQVFDTKGQEQRLLNALLRAKKVLLARIEADRSFKVTLSRVSPDDRDQVLASLEEEVRIFLSEEGFRCVDITVTE